MVLEGRAWFYMNLKMRTRSIGVLPRENRLLEVWSGGKFRKKKRGREGEPLTGGTERIF